MKMIDYLFLFSFLCSSALFGQKIFHIQSELLSVDNNDPVFYKKSLNNNEYHNLEIEVDILYDYDYQFKINNSGTDTKDYIFDKKKKLIETSSLDDNNEEEFRQQISSNPIYNIEEIDRGYIYELQYYNQIYLVVNEYKLDKRENKWKLIETEYHPYFFIRINNNKNVVIIMEAGDNDDAYIEGIIYSINNVLKAKISGSDFKPIKDMENITSNNLHDKNLISPHHHQLYRIGKNNQLYDFYFNQKLTDKFDKIEINQPFIIGKLKNKILIYNLALKEITPKKIKAIKKLKGSGSNLAQVLVKDELKWLDINGNLISQKDPDTYVVCGTVCYVNRKLEKDSLNYTLTSNVSCPNGIKKKYSYVLASLNKYEDISFLNATKELSFDDNTGTGAIYELPGNSLNYFIVKKESKYGLIEIDFKPDSIRQTDILPVEYDLIKFNGYYSPILLQKNGWYGYYPQKQSPKYKELSKFNYYFARFTLPNDKKGWLDIAGNEYFD